VKFSICWLFSFLPITLILEHAGKIPPPLLLAYGLYLVFALKTHPGAFASVEVDEGGSHDEHKQWAVSRFEQGGFTF
jgi:hypothetical protein